MKLRNTLLGALLCAASALSMSGISPALEVSASAADAGDSRAEARVIELNETYQETTADRTDQDFFKFTTTAHGYFQVGLKHNAADTHDTQKGWKVTICNENGDAITSTSGIKENWTSVVLPYAEKGSIFYVQAAPDDSFAAPENCVYDISISQTETQDWEAELNDTRSTATVIQTDKKYNGITISNTDEDFYKFTATEHGYFQVSLKHSVTDTQDTKEGWRAEILDENGDVITSAEKIRETWTSVIVPYAEKGSVFYIRITRSDSFSAPVNCVYDLTVSQKASSIWEAEPNDIKTAATSIKAGRTYHGITMSKTDEDYYKLSTAAGKLNIQLNVSGTNAADTKNGWNVVIYDKNFNEIARMERIKSKNSTSVNVKKGTFYIHVKANDSFSAPEQCMYDLTAAIAKTLSKPSALSAKASGTTAALNWKTVSGASGYYIYRSTSKDTGFQKVKTITKGTASSWKDNGLKTGTYYYKIAAYQKADGKTVTSSYSAAIPVTIH